MLLHKEKLAGSTVGATVQSMQRIVGRNEQGETLIKHSRFKDVVDENGHECGTVTKHYRLVTNGDLVAAMDLASDELGIDIEAGHGRYYNGRAQYTMYLGDEYRVPGDASGLRPQIVIGNSYGGKASLSGKAGVYRLVCTNGMIAGKVVRADYQRHIGEFDLLPFVCNLMSAVIQRAEEHKQIAIVAANTEFNTKVNEVLDEAIKAERERNRKFIQDLAENTPKKYHRQLRGAILENRRELGNTVWAISQAIAEVATHDMQGWSADTWQHKQTDRLFALAGVAV